MLKGPKGPSSNFAQQFLLRVSPVLTFNQFDLVPFDSSSLAFLLADW